MKPYRLLLLVPVALLAIACGPSRYTAPDVNLASIREFAFFEPYAVVTGYDANNQAYYDAADSRTEARMISGIIESERFPFTDMIPVEYEDKYTDDLRWISNFSQVDSTQIARLRVPKTFRRLMDASGCRYGVVIYAQGFIRSQEALQREAIVRGVARILDKVVEESTGKRTHSYVPYSSPYGNNMYLAVIDGETDRVVYFVKESPFGYSNPISQSDVYELVHKLLKDFIR